MGLPSWISRKWFSAIHGNNLIYNTCWEDPRIDRIALDLGADDTVAVITSAGCNVLDYALEGPAHVYAIDVNPRQNALLELKLAGIRALDFEPFFALFGRGTCAECEALYARHLRSQLTPFAQAFWDRRIGFFSGRGQRNSFYFRGTSGFVAYLFNLYLTRCARVRGAVDAILAARAVEEQQEIYYRHLNTAVWNRFLRWFLGRDTSLSLLGVPRAQKEQIDRHYAGGVAQFIEECIEAVFALLPLQDNYFWRVYLRGEYTRNCCPEYLRRRNFQRLKNGLVDRISLHTCSIESFLDRHDVPISRFVLLDHMDWLSNAGAPLLQREWQAIVNRAAPHTRIIWRSAGLDVDYIDPLQIAWGGSRYRLGDLLVYDRKKAQALHERDRVHTYGSFYIADMALA